MYTKHEAQGFSLIELMIVVAIIAILMAVAWPSYSNHVLKTRRATAAACLQERAQFMERFYTTQMTYVGAPAPAQCADIGNFYTIKFDANPTSKAYTLIAEAKGAQLKDKCGDLSLTAQGVRGSEKLSAEQCW